MDKIEQDTINIIRTLSKAIDRNNEEMFGSVIPVVMAECPKEKMNPELFATLIGYGISERLLSQLAYAYFPEAKENHALRFLIVNWNFMNSHIKNFVATIHKNEVCSADCSRWILDEYCKHLQDASYLPDMTVYDTCFWKPSFGTGDEWMKFCESIEKLWYGMSEDYIRLRSEMERKYSK